MNIDEIRKNMCHGSGALCSIDLLEVFAGVSDTFLFYHPLLIRFAKTDPEVIFIDDFLIIFV